MSACMLFTVSVQASISSQVEGQLANTQITATVEPEARYASQAVQVTVLLNYRDVWFSMVLNDNTTTALVPVTNFPPPIFGWFVPTAQRPAVDLSINDLLLAGQGLDAIDWVGLQVFVGYGSDWADMVNREQFKRVYPLEVPADAPRSWPLTPTSDAKMHELARRISQLLAQMKAAAPNTNLYDEAQDGPWVLWTQVLEDLNKDIVTGVQGAPVPDGNGQIASPSTTPATLPISSAGAPPGAQCGFNTHFYLDCAGGTITYPAVPGSTGVLNHTPTAPETAVPVSTLAAESGISTTPSVFSPLSMPSLLPEGLLGIKWLPWKCENQPTCAQATPPRDMPTPASFIGAMPATTDFPSTPAGFAQYTQSHLSWAYQSKLIPPLLNAGKLFFEECHSSVISQYAANPGWTKGSYDDTRIYGLTGQVTNGRYEFKCQEEGVFFANTLPMVLPIDLKANANFRVRDVYLYVDQEAAKLKRKSKFDAAKTTANVASGFVPFYGNVNSLAKCVSGYSFTDGLINLTEVVTRAARYSAPLDNWQDCVGAIPAATALFKGGVLIKNSTVPLTKAALWAEYTLSHTAATTFMQSNKYGQVLNKMGGVKSKLSDAGETYQAMIDYLDGRCAKQAVFCTR